MNSILTIIAKLYIVIVSVLILPLLRPRINTLKDKLGITLPSICSSLLWVWIKSPFSTYHHSLFSIWHARNGGKTYSIIAVEPSFSPKSPVT